MSFNPYAPPQSFPDQPVPVPAGGAGGPQPWGIEEVLRSSWEIVKQHWVALIFGPLIGGVIGNVPAQILNQIGAASKDQDTIIAMAGVGMVIGFFVQTFFTAGTIQLALTAARGGAPQVMQVFSGGSAYLRLLGTSLLVTLAIMGGFLLLIVPGIILALGFSMAPYYAVDAGMGPVEAMKASWEATTGHKANIFLFGLVGFVLMLAGLLACCVGMFPAQAVLFVGTAIIFTRISGRTGFGTPSPFGSVPSPFGGGGGFSPGGYGSGPTPPPGGGWGAA